VALEDAWIVLKAFCPNCGKLGMPQPDGTMICSDEVGCGFRTSDPETDPPRSVLEGGKGPKMTQEVDTDDVERRFIRKPRTDLTTPLRTDINTGPDAMFRPPPWNSEGGVKQTREKREDMESRTADEIMREYMKYRYGAFAPGQFSAGTHTTDWACNKCNAKDAKVQINQIRAADEAPSRLYTCNQCGHKKLEH
tara:strand:- start:793 stop:1374 length:582 start_codon:yes stop_codon:yes gene_type:complete